MLHSRLRERAFKYWLDNVALQQYDVRFDTTIFEDFCLDLIEDIARNEYYAEREREDFDDYVAEEFDFNLITAEELIKEFEREEQ